eukprot:TRINITY_DN1447_c0_g3_i1.p3 TRINITY_DN1447_c0_g3~~TRINITY_DN1447_c0_g3_i1.p3  ORF type:complete len:194 (-),score=15.64 TRINITY_DN1447_c0_g3_i1:323-904(-)
MSTIYQNGSVTASDKLQGDGRSFSSTRSAKKFTFEDLMSGKTSFKSWNKTEEDETTSSSTTTTKDTEGFKSLKQRWETGSTSSISPCSSIRSQESGDEEKSVGNILKKFQSVQVRNKPTLVSFSSFRPTSPATPEPSVSSVSSRKDMFNSMIKQNRKSERSFSLKSKSPQSKVGEEVESSYVKGRRALFESMK